MTAFAQIGGDWSFLIMLAIACVLLYLGIVKKYEPLLLVPIGMGVLLANFPGGGMGVAQADSEGYVMLADGTREIIWDMPLHKIAHELGLMNFIYYMCIKTGFIPPIIFMGVGALTDFGPMLRNLRLSIFGAGAQFGLSGRNEYMIRFFTDAGERNAWYSFYPLEDPAPEDVYGMEMKIRYKKRRPWMIEHIL